jgi:hypothetical protein
MAGGPVDLEPLGRAPAVEPFPPVSPRWGERKRFAPRSRPESTDPDRFVTLVRLCPPPVVMHHDCVTARRVLDDGANFRPGL